MNLWTQFNTLLNAAGPVFVGEVVSVESTFGDQRATVTLIPGGATLSVLGTGRTLEVGQRWLIQEGRIIEEGPTGMVVNVAV